jgi:hypothetical protein
MGKYFKEEETSNRIKRFKTSDVQEKNSRFAQISKISEITKVISIADKFLDFLKLPFKGLTKSTNLMKLRPALIKKIETKFLEISEQHDVYLKPQIESLKKIKDKMTLLTTEQYQAREPRKQQIANELAALEVQFDQKSRDISLMQKRAKDLVDAELEAFNKNNTLVGGQIKWNGDFNDPKLDYILGQPISSRGTKIVLDTRVKPQDESNLFDVISKYSKRTLDSVRSKNIDEIIKSDKDLGFDIKKYSFTDSEGNEEKMSLYQIIDKLANGTFKADLKADAVTLKKIHEDYNKFLVTLDKLEKGLTRNNPLLASVLASLPKLLKRGVPVAVVGVVTLPSIIQELERKRNPNKVKTDVQKAKARQSIPEINKNRQKAIDSMPQDMQDFMRELK